MCRSAETLQILFAPTHPQPIKGFGLHIRLLQIHSAALLRSLHNCTPTCNLRIVFRVALPTISIHCCWLKNKRKIQIGSHITAIQPTLFCSLMLGVHMVAVKGSLVLFTGPCQPVNGQLSLLLPALTTRWHTRRSYSGLFGSNVAHGSKKEKLHCSFLFLEFSLVLILEEGLKIRSAA